MSIILSATDEELIKKFSTLACRDDIADLLEITSESLVYILYRKDNPHPRYKSFTIKKRNGEDRIIHSPNPSLKIIQQKLNYILSLIYSPKPSVHGYTYNKSILTNAQYHIKKNHILNMDLIDFFPSINFGRVRGMFMSFFKLPKEPATILAQICSWENTLPQGAPTSPIVSNIICSKLDSQLQRFSRKIHCSYTRYADDLTFSTTKKVFPRLAAEKDDNGDVKIGSELQEIINENGFSINTQKVRLTDRQKRLEVTGLIVNSTPNVPRKYIRQVSSMLHAWEKFGEQAAETEYYAKYNKKNRSPEKEPPRFSQIIRGKINFIRMVKGEKDPIFRKLARKFNSLNQGIGFSNYFDNHYDEIISALWVLECEETFRQGTGFMLDGIGLVTCNHVLGSSTKAFRHDNFFEKYPIEILYKDETNDIAILKIDVKDPKFLKASKNVKFEHGVKITVAGFPNYSEKDTPYIADGKLTLYRRSQNRMMVSATIVTGNSGGPVLNAENEVIGIAVLGVDEFTNSSSTEKHGVIPIQLIDFILDAMKT